MIYKMDWQRAFPYACISTKNPSNLFTFVRVDEQEVGSPHVTFQYRDGNVWKKMHMVRTVLDDIVDIGGAKEVTDLSEKAKAFLLGAI
jgi:hypothetical protein